MTDAVRFIDARIEAILKRPASWGGYTAAETAILTFLEARQAALQGYPSTETIRRLIDHYKWHLNRAVPKINSLLGWHLDRSELTYEERDAEFRRVLGEHVEDVRRIQGERSDGVKE